MRNYLFVCLLDVLSSTLVNFSLSYSPPMVSVTHTIHLCNVYSSPEIVENGQRYPHAPRHGWEITAPGKLYKLYVHTAIFLFISAAVWQIIALYGLHNLSIKCLVLFTLLPSFYWRISLATWLLNLLNCPFSTLSWAKLAFCPLKIFWSHPYLNICHIPQIGSP